MAKSGGIPGTAVAMATAGAFLLYVGIAGVPIRDGLKAIVGGKLPEMRKGGGGALDKAEAALGGVGKSSGSGSAPPLEEGSGAGGAVAAAAREYLGVPYALGGMSKQGIDCSGLVVRAFQAAYDITPPRTTYTQVAWKQLRKIQEAQLQPGDLCFWPAGGAPSHVAIYYGSGKVIHAPRPGKKVEIVPIRQAFTGGLKPSCYTFVGDG
ncbi:C40 family peptidase [Streptomyces sp. NPDC056264]|uniref:C40 family peptidase n=1 Tax=Streptomyces sp. NPDC056264 TaxID=3345767 RepID=UPI003AACB427